MSKSRILIIALAFLLVVTAITSAEGDTHTILLNSTDVSTLSPGDSTLGDCFVFSFDLPSNMHGKTLYRAMLEFYVDVSARENNGLANNSPIIGVYALKSTLTGEIDASKFHAQSPAVRNVLVGNDRKVKVNITDIVRGFLENSQSNYGLVVGSLVGSRDGLFTLKSGAFSGDAWAKIELHYGSR